MEDIRKEIASGRMKPEELFSSNAFYRHLRNIMAVALTDLKRSLRRTITIHPFCDPKGNGTAWTDGSSVSVNTMGPLIRTQPSLTKMYYAVVGHVAHECCHILFTDFNEAQKRMEPFLSDEFFWYPKAPETENADEIISFLSTHRNYRMYCSQIYHTLDNIMEDVYIENRMYDTFHGTFSLGQKLGNKEIFEMSPTIEKMMENAVMNHNAKINIVLQILQIRALGFTPKTDGTLAADPLGSAEWDDISKTLEACQPFLDDLAWQTDAVERGKDLNEVFARLYKYLPTLKDEEQQNGDKSGDSQESNDESSSDSSESSGSKKENGSSSNSEKKSGSNGSGSSKSSDSSETTESSESSGSSNDESDDKSDEKSDKAAENAGSGDDESKSEENEKNNSETPKNDLTEDDLKELADALVKALAEAGRDTESDEREESNDSRPASDEEEEDMDQDKVNAAKKEDENLSESENAADRGADRAFDDIHQEIRDEEAEAVHCRQLSKEAYDIKKACSAVFEGSGYKNWNYCIRRPSYPDRDSMELYGEILSDVKGEADATIRKLNSVLKERERAGYSRGYTLGRFDSKALVKSSYYGDGKCFKRRNEPTGTPKTAFSVLVDMSGSMDSDGKYEKAREAVILLDAVLSGIGCAYSIFGHTCYDYSTDIFAFKDFESCDKYDKYRLTEVNAYLGNRDGAAIAYCCEKLLKRPEPKKVLIVVSDGQPTECAFASSGDAVTDTKTVIEHYRQKGIVTFGAVIDGEINRIRSIYGARTIDLTERGNLSTELAGIVKRFVTKR